jgi:hypothetical protein
MGVDASVIVFKGWALDHDKIKDVNLDYDLVEKMTNDDIYAYWEDGMCGEYALFGVRMAHEYIDGGSEGFDFEELKIPEQTDFDIANRFYQFTGLDIHDFVKEGKPDQATIMIHTIFS